MRRKYFPGIAYKYLLARAMRKKAYLREAWLLLTRNRRRFPIGDK
jgi:hypothetical protein